MVGFLLIGIVICWLVLSSFKEQHDENNKKHSEWLND